MRVGEKMSNHLKYISIQIKKNQIVDSEWRKSANEKDEVVAIILYPCFFHIESKRINQVLWRRDSAANSNFITIDTDLVLDDNSSVK